MFLILTVMLVQNTMSNNGSKNSSESNKTAKSNRSENTTVSNTKRKQNKTRMCVSYTSHTMMELGNGIPTLQIDCFQFNILCRDMITSRLMQ